MEATRGSRKESHSGERAGLTPQTLDENAILRGLEESTASTVMQHGSLVRLSVREQIYEPEKPILQVYFPLDSVLSIVTRMKDGNQIEVGTIGREGMSAFPLLMGASSTANDCYCQVPGSAVRIDANIFRELSVSSPRFRQLLDRYLQAYVNMLGQLAACNRTRRSAHARITEPIVTEARRPPRAFGRGCARMCGASRLGQR